jgi:hypothetical protein
MAIWPKAKFLFSVSFISLIVGVVAFYYEVYGSRTSLVVDIVSESNVMDVKTPLKDLSILFQGRDIQKENSNLRILGVRVINEGTTNVLESYFDSRIPWGLRIDGGRLVEARVTGSNSQYLSDNLHARVTGADEVDFDKVIFDRGKYVTLELLVLHDKTVEPHVKPIGKIAGMEDIPVRDSFRERDQEGFSAKAFKGPIAVQIARTVGYFLIAIGVMSVLALSITGIASIPSGLKKRSRRKQARYLLKEDSPERERKRQVLVNVFIENGPAALVRMQEALNDAGTLAKAVTSGRRRVHVRNGVELPVHVSSHVDADGYIEVRSSTPLNAVVEAGLVRRNGTKIEVDPDLKNLLTNLIEQVSQTEDKGIGGVNLGERTAEKKGE